MTGSHQNDDGASIRFDNARRREAAHAADGAGWLADRVRGRHCDGWPPARIADDLGIDVGKVEQIMRAEGLVKAQGGSARRGPGRVLAGGRRRSGA